MTIDQKLEQVCREFCIPGTYLGHEVIRVGNVNKTYQVKVMLPEGREKSFLVQNVNTYVFKNPVQVMENIDKVTEHIRAKSPDRVSLHFHHTAQRSTFVAEGEDFWRMTNFIPSVTYGIVEDMRIVRNAGRAFGEFQMQLSDFDSTLLHETIVGFHNTRSRYQNLKNTVAQDPMGKVASVSEELSWLFFVEDMACRLTDMCDAGGLPLRVTHNDTKINNVLFHPDGITPLVVVDLDTVMPGLVAHDFGDSIRYSANFVEEDCPDTEKAGLNMEVFRAFTEGFLSATAQTLTDAEVDTLALGAFVLSVELAVRFLDDYIQGSPYFKIDYPEHNLVRARCQIALAKDMQRKLDEMNACVRDCAAAAGR